MPLINYAIGDLVQLPKSAPDIVKDPASIERFQGREKDCFQINKRTYCLGEVENLLQDVTVDVLQYQLVITGHQINFLYTTSSDLPCNGAEEYQLTHALRELIPNELHLNLKWCSSIAPESSGKFSIIKFYK